MSKEPNNIRIVPNKDKFKGAQTFDNQLQVEFTGDRKTMVEGDRTVILNLAERFDKERQKSNTFRVTGKITNIFNNVISGKTNYNAFKNDLFYINPIESAKSGVWKGYPQFDEFTFFRTQGIDGHIPFVTKSSSTYNWMVYLSYASENVTGQSMSYHNEMMNTTTNFIASDGVPFVMKKTKYNGKPLITFYCGTNHNLSTGEYIKTSFNYNGNDLFQVYQLGDEAYGTEGKVFSIFDLGYTGTTFGDGVTGTFKRVINFSNTGETTSEYYIRKHTILTDPKDYNLTRMGFENNPFNNNKKLEYADLTPNGVQRTSVRNGSQSFGFTFEKDIDINKNLDNQDRPITELFVTIIQKGYMGWFNKPFGNFNTAINVGWEFNFLSDSVDDWWNVSSSNNKDNLPVGSYQYNNQTFYYNKDLKSGDKLMGDFCEWNNFMMEEKVLSPMVHKYNFNPVHFQNDSIQTMPDGYLYYPHYPIKVRDFSDYIEQGVVDEVDFIPDYSFYSEYESKWRWRDLYPYGYIDSDGVGVDHPFLNNSHYPFKDINFIQTPPTRNFGQRFNVIGELIIDDCE